MRRACSHNGEKFLLRWDGRGSTRNDEMRYRKNDNILTQALVLIWTPRVHTSTSLLSFLAVCSCPPRGERALARSALLQRGAPHPAHPALLRAQRHSTVSCCVLIHLAPSARRGGLRHRNSPLKGPTMAREGVNSLLKFYKTLEQLY
jgi:hypothetical protein